MAPEKLERLEFDFSGAKFTLAIPNKGYTKAEKESPLFHGYTAGAYAKDFKGFKYNLYDTAMYRKKPKSCFEFPHIAPIFNETFEYRGLPIIDGEVAGVGLRAFIYYTNSDRSISDQADFDAFFIGILNNNFKPEPEDIKSWNFAYLYPVNWIKKKYNTNYWARCSITSSGDPDNYLGNKFWCATPLGGKHLLMLNFNSGGASIKDPAYKLIQDLIDTILSESTLQLSPSMLEDLESGDYLTHPGNAIKPFRWGGKYDLPGQRLERLEPYL